MDLNRYILRNRKPVPASTLEWSVWFERIENRRVAFTVIEDLHVSTVFLGLDHNFGGAGPPILFETMIFDEPHEGRIFGRSKLVREEIGMERTCTWDEAVAAHERACEKLRKWITASKEIADGAIHQGRARKERPL
jgi:hypothetical protein